MTWVLLAYAALSSLAWGERLMTLRPQSVQGWWTVRIREPQRFANLKLRLTLPPELPASTHLHLVVLEETGAPLALPPSPSPAEGAAPATFTGLLPTAYLWHVNGLTPLASGEVWIESLAPSQYETQAGARQSEAVAHGAQSHATVSEWSPGSRTPWLDLTAILAGRAPEVTALRLAFACYHQAGPDQAFQLYPCQREAVTPLTPRAYGDYSNDPLLLYGAWRARGEAASRWRDWLPGGGWPTHESRLVSGAWLASLLAYPTWPASSDDTTRVDSLARWLEACGKRYEVFIGGEDVEVSKALL
ncbi:MAG: hypothetical protein V3S00_03590, partial [Dehalococcoidia bacterium]